jgi:hypothetical protein
MERTRANPTDPRPRLHDPINTARYRDLAYDL